MSSVPRERRPPSTPARPTPVATPHQQRAANAARTTDAPAPSRAGTQQSPRQERASKRAAQPQPPRHHTATGIQGHRASRAGRGPVPSPTNTGAEGTRPEHPAGTARPHRRRTQASKEARNLKHHPARLHTVNGRQPARQQQHRPDRSPARTMAHLTGRQRAQHTPRPKSPPRRHTPLPRPTPPPPGPPTPCAPTPRTPPRA